MRLKTLIKKFIPSFLLGFYHYLLAAFSAFLYNFPSRKIKVIGITGTSGKTTATELVSRILEEAGYKTAVLSSIKFKIGNQEEENKLKMTMPGRTRIQKFLSQAVKSGCKYAVLEVTSEGIKQYRHKFIDFDIAVFTNLTPEHIESHQGFENYKKAKGELFKATKEVHIINLDDKNAEYFLKFSSNQKYLYKISSQNGFFSNEEKKKFSSQQDVLLLEKVRIDAQIKLIEAKNCQASPQGIDFTIEDISFHLDLLGSFNIYNALAAVCAGLSQGISLKTCKSALEKAKGVPGRMEIVVKEPFSVIVDYAHTPNSLKKVYQTVRDFKFKVASGRQIQSRRRSATADAKLICVLGSCGGGRDKWKRPVLGKIAAEYCDRIIVTNEDPYDEDPLKIIKDVESGFLHLFSGSFAPKYYEILDRRKAIRKALSLAGRGDIVVITGKGSECWMCLKNGKKIPWDDRQCVREEMKKLENF